MRWLSCIFGHKAKKEQKVGDCCDICWKTWQKLVHIIEYEHTTSTFGEE